MTPEDLDSLSNHWMHSFEEDSTNEMVFRPSDHDFPRARGRKHLDLRKDGHARDLSPGKNDVPEAMIGFWLIDGDQLSISFDKHPTQRFHIKGVWKDKLVLNSINV